MLPFKNQSQFEKIFKENWELMYQSAYHKVKDQVIVEDMIQEIFFDLWKRKETLQIRTDLKAYLLTAVKYQVMKHFDEQAKSRANQLDFSSKFYEEDVFGFEELYKEIEIAIEMLPPKAQLIFRMSKLEGMSVEEISKKLNLSPQTIHNQLSKSLKVLRGELKHLAPVVALLLIN